MRYIFLLIFGIATAEVIAKRRLRRQILPSKHIQVHSLDSKVLLDDVSNLITVDSPDSRVELSEKNVNGTIWAEKSKVQFDSYDTFVNATAEVAQSIMNILNCAFIHGFSLESTLFMVTNRTADGHTYLNHQMYDNANVSIRDEGVQIQGIGGRRVGVEAQTWDKYLEKTMTLTAVNNNENGDRELMLSIVAPQYKIDVCFVGAMIYIEFGDKLVQIDPDFTSVNIYTSKYLINFRTKDLVTPYDIKLTNEQIIIRCPQEQTSVFVQPDGVNVNVEEFNKMQLDRGGGEMILGGHAMHADSVRVISLSALLNLANNGHIRADTTKSEILVQTPVQNVGLTARHHDIQVLGGVPRLLIEAGMACVEVTSSIGMPESIHLIPPFAPPEDRYLTIGPYQEGNVTASPISFPNPSGLNVTQSPLDGCGGGFGAIPRNQTLRPPTDQTTVGPVIPVTHEIVTYHTLKPNEGHQTEITTLPTDTASEQTSITEVPSEETTIEITTTQTLTTIEENVELTTISPVIPETEQSATYPTTSQYESTFSTNENNVEDITTDLTTFDTTVELTSTTEIPEETTTETFPQPSELPGNEILSTEELPSSTISQLGETIPTEEIPQPSELPMEELNATSTEPMPEPSPFPTDDFIIGHWFSTEESGEKKTTEFPEIGITATIGNVGVATNFPVGEGSEIPTPPQLGEVAGTSTTPVYTTESDIPSPGTLLPEDIPSPGPFTFETTQLPPDTSTAITIPSQQGDVKMLILKMRVPDGIDVNSPAFARNITMSLKRLVRDTKNRLKKRHRRSSDPEKYPTLLVLETQDAAPDFKNTTEQEDTKLIGNSNSELPIRVNGITKFKNVTEVTFTFDEIELTQEELEAALYELETQELDEYLTYPATEHISFVKYHENPITMDRKHIMIIGFLITAIIIVLVFATYYFLKNGETSIILKRMGRHFSKYTAPTHSNNDAFERNSA